jgi:hypothetical protein
LPGRAVAAKAGDVEVRLRPVWAWIRSRVKPGMTSGGGAKVEGALRAAVVRELGKLKG